jgi:hypothetical protein
VPEREQGEIAMARHRHVLVLVLAIVLAACQSAPVSTPSPTAAPGRTATPSGSAPTSTSTPLPTSGDVAWQQIPQPGLGAAVFIHVVKIGDEFFAAGCRLIGDRGCDEPVIWRSRDGLDWAADLPVEIQPDLNAGTVTSVASSRAGLVAGGSVSAGETVRAAVWLRMADGWRMLGLPEQGNAAVGTLIPRGDGLVALGFGAFLEAAGFEAWRSADGAIWQAATTPQSEGFPDSALEVDSNLVAWGPSCSYCIAPSAWWVSPDGGAWQEFQAPRGLEQATLTSLGRTNDGFIAFGSLGGGGDVQVAPSAWESADFGTWEQVASPSGDAQDTVYEQIVVGNGVVAAGTRTGEDGLSGIVWTRAPGETEWVEDLVLPGLETVGLLNHPEPGRIVLIGRISTEEGDRVDTWTRRLDWLP